MGHDGLLWFVSLRYDCAINVGGISPKYDASLLVSKVDLLALLYMISIFLLPGLWRALNPLYYLHRFLLPFGIGEFSTGHPRFLAFAISEESRQKALIEGMNLTWEESNPVSCYFSNETSRARIQSFCG